MAAGDLDRLIQFKRSQLVDDGYAQTETWKDETGPFWYGDPIWAKKKDVSDGEKWRAAQLDATVTTRFTVRWSAFASEITPKDRLVCEGVEYSITGIKEVGARYTLLEITASAGTDL